MEADSGTDSEVPMRTLQSEPPKTESHPAGTVARANITTLANASFQRRTPPGAARPADRVLVVDRVPSSIGSPPA